MKVSEREVLEEIANIIAQGESYSSREQGKKFFHSYDLPKVLNSYIVESRKAKLNEAAKMFGMSKRTLEGILQGAPLSENMIFRLRNSLEYALGHPGISVLHDEEDVYLGDWKRTNTTEVQHTISVVSEKLVFLKKVIESSNVLKSEDSPIDKLQIAQLIALLEAMLAAIRAPYLEKNQTRGFFNWLRKLGRRGIEKGLEKQVSDAIDEAVGAGSDLLTNLPDTMSAQDLGNIIT